MQYLNRIDPQLPPQAMQTYRILAPLATHWKPVTCAQTGWCPGPEPCGQCTAGWLMPIDEATDLGQRQAAYLRRQSGRTFREQRSGALTIFTFAGGQRCFQDHPAHEHRARVEREERFLITGGDYRGNPRRTRPVELSAGSWADDFGEHQETLNTAFERG